MVRFGRGLGLLPVLASVAVAVVLAGAAVVTVHQAGCTDPGRYIHTGHGIVLVGGCLQPGDLPVLGPREPPPPAVPAQPAAGAAAPLQS